LKIDGVVGRLLMFCSSEHLSLQDGWRVKSTYIVVGIYQGPAKTHTWASKTERARLVVLIFSAARTLALSAVYMGFHCAQKYLHSMFRTISSSQPIPCIFLLRTFG
jgi:hypothetical protein